MCRDIFSAMGVFTTVRDILSIMEGVQYHDGTQITKDYFLHGTLIISPPRYCTHIIQGDYFKAGFPLHISLVVGDIFASENYENKWTRVRCTRSVKLSYLVHFPMFFFWGGGGDGRSEDFPLPPPLIFESQSKIFVILPLPS